MARPLVPSPPPDSPTRPRVSPRRTVNEMSSTARTQPTCRCRMMPWVIGKYIFRCSTRKSSPSAVPSLGIEMGLALVAMSSLCLLNALRDGLSVGFPAAGDVDPARDAMARDDGFEARVFGPTALDGVRATRLEWAPWRCVDQVGR